MSTQTRKPRVFGLVRSSTLEQEASPKVQMDLIAERAKRIDAEYMGCEVDEGVSASKVPFLARPGVKRLTKFLAPGDHVIIWKLDRIARKMRDICDVIDWQRQTHIHLHVLNFGDKELDLGDDIGKIIAYALTMGGEMESSLIRTRTKESLQWRKSQGLPYHSRPRLGYRRLWGVHKEGRRVGMKKFVGYEWCGEEWQVIKWIYEQYKKRRPLQSIARELYDKKMKTADGNKLWGTVRANGTVTVARVQRAIKLYEDGLKNGEIEIKGGEIIPGPVDIEFLRKDGA